MFASWRKHFSIVLLLVMGMAGATAAQAVAPPNIITYQGRVLNTNGVPVSNTSLSMKFFLYTAVTGGTCLWSNSSADCNSNVPASTTARSVSLTTGLFTQNLGDTGDSFAAIGSTIFGDNAAVYLEVDIAGETLTPRRRLTAAPYALNAQTLDGLSSADFDLDRVYDNDSGSALAIDGASGLTFTSSVAANFTINLASTGDFVIQDNGTAFATFNDSGNVAFTGDLSVLGDDLTMGTNTLGALLVADGTNFNPVVLSGDATISAAGALAIAANSVALTTDTTGNYVASIADAGNSTVTVVNGSAEGGAVTLNVIDVNCTDCLGATEISDIYLLNSGDTITSDLTFSNGTTDSPNATFSPATGTSWLLYVEDAGDDFQILTNTASTETIDILNGGAGVIDVTVDGGMTLGGDLTISGDDLFMTTNNAGYILVGDNTNYNPVALSGDATLASTGALSIAANSVALSTDTTGNYVASTSTSVLTGLTGGSSGSEGAALSLAFDYSQALSGDVGLSANAGVFGISGFAFEGSTADTIETYISVTDPTASDKTITIPNLTGTVILSGHTFTGDVTATLGASNTTALTIAADSVALSTDTTGNYVATLTDAGGSDFAITNSGSEGAAVTIDLANDAVDWDEIVDAMTLDASTSITMDGTEDFSFVNGGTGGVIVNLTATGDFMVQDNSQAYFTVNDDSTIDIISTATTGDVLDITATSLTTAAAIDLDASHAPTAGGTVTAVDLGLTNAATTSAATYRGLSLAFTNNPTVAGNTEYLLNLSNAATANTTDNAVAAMIRIDNADTSATGSTVISDGLLVSVSGAISNGIVDAIDASDANITNALNFGVNTVLGTTGNIDMDNFDVVGATGNVTLGGDLTVSGDDLFMGTNMSGFILVADGTNFNPVAVSGDMAITSAGALTVNDDALDFSEFQDTLDLDAATDINLGANLFSIDLDSTGDFAIRDGTTNVVLFEDDSTIDITFPTAAFLTIDASTTANTNTTGVIDLNVSAGDAAVDALNIALVQNNGATGGTQATGMELTLEGNDADGDMFGVRVTGQATINAAAGTYDALLVLTNNENTAGAVTDAIRITSGASTAASITTGLDFDTTDITTDIEMQNNLTISNDDNNDLTFTENSVSLNIDFAEVSSTYIHTYSATGLLFESDQNFLIDAGDGLPNSLVDGTDIQLRPEDDAFFNLSAISAVRIDAQQTDSQETGGVLDIDVDTTTASNVGIDLNYQIVDDAAATAETMTALNILLDQYDISGNTTRGLFIQQRAVTATSSGNALNAGIVIDNADTDADAGGGGDTAAAMTDAIRITGTGTGAITTGLDFDTSNIVTDIELQNAETISNDSDGKIAFGISGSDELQLTATELAPVADGGLDLGVSAQPFGDLYLSGGQLFANNAFDIDIDDNTASAFTISEGSTNYLAFTTSNTGETATLGNSGLDSLTITTDNTAATDVGITGGLTVTSGATHNSFTVTSSADTETGALVTANSLTTGKGLSVTSSSTGFTSGTLLDIDYDASGSLSAKTTTFAEITNGRENTATSGALGDNYDLVKIARSSTQNGVGGAFSSVGSVLYVENAVAATAGTITDTANGIKVLMDPDGTGHGMIITMGVVGSPAANNVNNQGLVIDVNETASADAVFLIRSDADGTADTEFRVDNDGDFQYDGTASTPASDLAEVYPSAQALAPGDLVALDSTGGLKIAKTTQPFQGGLFGAISTKPAIRMGADAVGYDVALVGRIPLKVSGEAGAIAVGDPLTASSTVGHAMKATRAGMIVGYALEALDETGTGVINAFIDVGWFAGNVIGTDGLSTILTDAVVVAPLGTATASAPTFDSFGLSLRGSAWNGNEAAAVEMMLRNVVTSPDEYRLSVRNTTESEVAYITNEGTMRIAGDMVVGGRLYPSDRGTPQTDKYIYYDGSSGPAGDFMRTNAKGWSTGSYDFAEMFPSDEKLVSGEIVVFTGETIRRSTGAQGERLAGIVSTRPGFLAGENVEGAYPIALAGRVPTKVSVENGAIVVGDPLTASTNAGVAMKATHSGQIVGYALERYDVTDSDNLILAYVNVGYWSGGPQTVTIIQNVASQAPSGAQNVSALNMSGNIFLATNEILSIGRLEGMAASWSIERDGTIKTQALVKTVIESYQGTKVETIAVTSPEAVITLTGTAKLVEGKAEVRFEDVLPEFNDVISAIAPVRVIVTPSGPVSLYVSEKDQNHFVVQRFVGEADVEFDWMVTGYRKGFEPPPPVIPSDSEGSPSEESSGQGDPSSTDEPRQDDIDTEEQEPVVEEPPVKEEPATPESPEETIVDPVTDDDGGEPAEEPSEVVDDQIIDPPEEPTAAE